MTTDSRAAGAPSEPLADRVRRGDARALARAISLSKTGRGRRRSDSGGSIRTGRAQCIGVTGPPGAGKEHVVDRLIAAFRAQGRTIGVIAVDPTSPYSGGADSRRPCSHAGALRRRGSVHPHMATRGQLGGLARATSDVALLLDAAARTWS